jgi:thiol-disulfide isomerase/thioredoxin
MDVTIGQFPDYNRLRPNMKIASPVGALILLLFAAAAGAADLPKLEGKPTPALEASVWFGPKPPSIASLRGKPVLLFFWAHWCPDCKAEVFVIANLMKKYGPKGLALIGPTRYYGYAARGEAAPPEVEKAYIDVIRREYYTLLARMPVPLSDANFVKYGAEATPTLVLLDRQGIVSWYHPGTATEEELGAHIEAVLQHP